MMKPRLSICATHTTTPMQKHNNTQPYGLAHPLSNGVPDSVLGLVPLKCTSNLTLMPVQKAKTDNTLTPYISLSVTFLSNK